MEAQQPAQRQLTPYPSSALTVYTPPPPPPDYYSQAISAMYYVGSSLASIPGYFSSSPLSPEEAERDRNRKRIEFLTKQISTAQQAIIEKQKNFETSWKITLESQIRALKLNNAAFETMQILFDSLLQFKTKIFTNEDFSRFLENSTNLSEIRQTSPLEALCIELKKQIDYFTTGQYSEQSTERFNTLTLLNILQESSAAILKYELKRIKDRFDHAIERAEERSKPTSSGPDPKNLKIFKTVDLAFKTREKIEGDLNAYLSSLNSTISRFLDIDMPTEDVSVSKSTYLGSWFGPSSPQVKALPEFSKKHLISKYNEFGEQAFKAREEFRRFYAELNIRAEEYKAAKALLRSLTQEKNRMENAFPELTILSGDEGEGLSEDDDLTIDEESESEDQNSLPPSLSQPYVNPAIEEIRERTFGQPSPSYPSYQNGQQFPNIYSSYQQTYSSQGFPPSGFGPKAYDEDS